MKSYNQVDHSSTLAILPRNLYLPKCPNDASIVLSQSKLSDLRKVSRIPSKSKYLETSVKMFHGPNPKTLVGSFAQKIGFYRISIAKSYQDGLVSKDIQLQ